jgi:hypothetical protein
MHPDVQQAGAGAVAVEERLLVVQCFGLVQRTQRRLW